MTTSTQPYNRGEFLISEANGERSRSQVTVTIAGSVALPSGTVLGKITASGKYVAHNSEASNGSEVAAGILYNNLAGVNGDYQATAFLRSAEVIGSVLNGGAGVASPAAASLLALGIVVR